MSKLWGITKGEMQKKHILFQEEDRETYIRVLLEPVIPPQNQCAEK
ncbi:hypothetical protein K1I42_09995 [Hydrogenophilus thermoluteolus]|nr:hypothetical protein [Hydrogenophilus thermoluteolus]MBW7657618.1 hypothetical protein [Hydrogenophilus thermoluteolus]